MGIKNMAEGNSDIGIASREVTADEMNSSATSSRRIWWAMTA